MAVPGQAKFDFGASGVNPVVTGVSGVSIQVKHYCISFGADATLHFYNKHSSTLTDLTGTLTPPSGGGIFMSPFAPQGGGVAEFLFTTQPGDDLVLKIDATTNPAHAAGYLDYNLV